jgi:hypothetical protein
MTIDQRTILLTELEGLQARRRSAVDAFTSTGNQACWREVRDTSQAIADKLRELEEMHDPASSVCLSDALASEPFPPGSSPPGQRLVS